MGLWWQLCGNPFSLPSVFLSRAAGLTVRGREGKKKKRGRLTRLRKTHSSRMRSFFQDAHAALTLTLQRVDGRRPSRPSGFKTSHALVHQAAGLYNFWSASSDIRFTPSVGSGQPRQPRCVCFVFLSAVHYRGINAFAFDLGYACHSFHSQQACDCCGRSHSTGSHDLTEQETTNGHVRVKRNEMTKWRNLFFYFKSLKKSHWKFQC